MICCCFKGIKFLYHPNSSLASLFEGAEGGFAARSTVDCRNKTPTVLHQYCSILNYDFIINNRKEVIIMIICPWKDLKRYIPTLPGVEEAIAAVDALDSYEANTYPLSDGNRFFVTVGTTIAPTVGEAHRRYLDIQYIVKGQEVMGYAPLASCTPAGEFGVENDCGMYSGPFQYLTIGEGMCYVAFPEDVHMPGRHLEVPNDYVKVVVKLKV